MSPPPEPPSARPAPEPAASGSAPGARRPELAARALGVTAALYLAYAAVGRVWPAAGAMVLIAGFLLVPRWMLRHDPERAARWQVGPERLIPPWSPAGGRLALLTAAIVVPPFVALHWAFYADACAGGSSLLAPVIWLEAKTPAAGSLERFLGQQCRSYGGDGWPWALRLPGEWWSWGGLGIAYFVVLEILVIALPEELFHRGYLMSSLEERWPPRGRVFGTPFGWAAVLSSLVFAVGHLVGEARTDRLATFFPGLLFAWLFRRSGSLWAPILIHAGANLLMQILLASTFPR